MNKIAISAEALGQIRVHGEFSYPDEEAGLLLGKTREGGRIVHGVHSLENRREGQARRKRYLIEAVQILRSGEQGEFKGLEVVGVFHSHPNHPAQPSDTDREWALPWYSYVITSVEGGMAQGTTSWRLREDRPGFEEERIESGDGAVLGWNPMIRWRQGGEQGAG